MGIRETVLGWLRSSDAKGEDLRDAEIDEATREYSSDRADGMAEGRFRSRPGEFEQEQDGPRR